MRAWFLVLALVSGCLPNNRSGDFECSTDEQCNDGRSCDRGYCVMLPIDAPPPCPDECQTCDLETKDCTIVCDSPNECDRAECPPDYDCVIQCTNTNACDIVDCTDAASCQITCSGSGTCDVIECGDGACNINCTGSSSCAQVDCASSCRCDVSCGASAVCDTSCPPAPVPPALCTENGMINTPCDSGFDAACASC